MPVLDAIATQKAETLSEKQLLRAIHTSERIDGVEIIREGRKLISFSCNDYLGLSKHPEVIEASIEATVRYGAGAGASRLVTGNHPLYDDLEMWLAKIKGTEEACVFGSGYLANLGTVPAVINRNDLILADKLIHACLLDGAQLSGAKLLRYRHNDLDHCQYLLDQSRHQHDNCLIITESVFSMDGDLAPIPELIMLAEKNDAWLMTDDAHGLGVLAGKRDVGAQLQMGTLSKAVGSYGGYVCGSSAVIELIKSTARSFVYSTGLPPAVVGASIAALQIIQRDPALTAQPLLKARQFTALAGLPEAQSAIVPVMMGDTEQALEASKKMEKAGFLVVAIRPPTVPDGTARLRFAFSALHADSEIERAAEIVRNEGWGK